MEMLKNYKKQIVIVLLIIGGVIAMFQFNWAGAKDVDTTPNTEAIDSTAAVVDSTATTTEVVNEDEDQPLEDLDSELNDQE